MVLYRRPDVMLIRLGRSGAVGLWKLLSEVEHIKAETTHLRGIRRTILALAHVIRGLMMPVCTPWVREVEHIHVVVCCLGRLACPDSHVMDSRL